MRTVRFVIGVLVLVGSARTAGAAWPADGTPVATGAIVSRALGQVVPDGAGALFVAYVHAAPSNEVRVQRLRADGTLTPGWSPDGVAPTGPVSLQRSNPHVLPDGAGGCYVAWDEGDGFYYYVRIQHLLASSALDPAWPAGGVVLAQGTGPRFGISDFVSVAGLAPAMTGGCNVAISLASSGCHDGFCASGGSVYSIRVSATGTPSPQVLIESCSSFANGTAAPDGGDGLFALTSTGCPNEMRFRHVVVGGEPYSTLPVNGTASFSLLTRAADGSVLATVERGFLGPPVWFHWNADGSPAAGAPASGVVMPAGPWKAAHDGSGSSVHVWQPSGTPGPLYGLRLAPDGSNAPGWPAAGLPLASAPALVEPFSASTDGAGGVVVVWQDRRAGSANRDVYAMRRFADGAPASGAPGSGDPLCTAAGPQSNPRVVTLAPGVSIAVWEDGRSGTNTELYAQRIALDTPVAATASLARAEARPDRVLLEWRFSEPVPEVILQRSRDGDEWTEIARLVPGSLGRVQHEDTDVQAGESLAYRITYASDGQQFWTVPVWVEVPRAELAMRVMPPTARDRLSLEITLASHEAAKLDLIDVSGRRLQSHDLGRFGTDPTRLELDLGGVASGIGWLRLRQGSEIRTLRVAITR